MSSFNFQPPAQGLPEVAESAATGAVAALYADIRAALGVDLVNLVYRHLATVPGALEWAWANLGPRVRSGEIDAQAALLRERVQQAFTRWPQAFDFASVRPGDRAGAVQVVHVYNLNNCRNLMAFRHLLGAWGGEGDAAGPRVVEARAALSDTAATQPLPAIPAWDALCSVDRERVLRLNRLGEHGEPAIVASLYRHLALWPTLLAEVEAGLLPIDARRELARALAFTVETSSAIARAHPLAMPEPAPPAVDAALRARLRVFADITIPKMVPVGLALEAALAVDPQRFEGENPCT